MSRVQEVNNWLKNTFEPMTGDLVLPLRAVDSHPEENVHRSYLPLRSKAKLHRDVFEIQLPNLYPNVIHAMFKNGEQCNFLGVADLFEQYLTDKNAVTLEDRKNLNAIFGMCNHPESVFRSTFTREDVVKRAADLVAVARNPQCISYNVDIVVVSSECFAHELVEFFEGRLIGQVILERIKGYLPITASASVKWKHTIDEKPEFAHIPIV